ncbi:hypothetical protein GCM10027271_30850 [Saccharopolyspora gloriosae]|uniref:DUF1918 domain-containing protein n=1 Tax=Saccharopolyspora gloriosae TaxID=455344 RepID=A0A840NJ03_9PSEU|nr:DUF1918 domain-containing protein [Saccharopolyspora gloriosae]MBB5070015.1 hypothetical protein [Saccharopolyspora gloriosae]
MYAEVGEWLIVEGIHLDDPRRKGQITEVRGPDGTPPYVVHWLEDGHVSLFFPGPDTHTEKALPHHLKLDQAVSS